MSEFDSVPSATIAADIGEGLVTQDVTAWSVSRSLSGGGLPGQARAASGSSVGQGTVSVESPAGRTPWTAGPIKPGGVVALDAAEDIGVAAAPQGRMVVRSVSADSALSASRTLSIEDDLTALRGRANIIGAMYPTYAWTTPEPGAQDASFVVDVAARAAGYYSTPKPPSSCFFSVPFTGSPLPEVGSARLVSVPRYDELFGQASVSNAYVNGPPGASPFSTGHIFFSFDAAYADFGSAYATLSIGAGSVNIVTADIAIASSADNRFSINWQPSVVWTRVIDPAFPNRVQGEVEFLGMPADRSSATGVRLRLRTGPSIPWSAWITYTYPTPVDLTVPTEVSVTAAAAVYTGAGTGRSGVRGVLACTTDEPAVWTQPTARINLSRSPLYAALPDARTSWDIMQEMAAATMGAVWIGEDGVLNYRSRDNMRGASTAIETVVAERSLDDVPWSISNDEVADRVELTYRPPDIQVGGAEIFNANHMTINVWSSTEVVEIRAGRTITIEQDLDGAAFGLAPWYPVWDTTYAANRFSRWAASTQRDGGGARPADTALTVTSSLVTPSRLRIRITNNTTGTLYTAGTDGTTMLLQRGTMFARAGEPRVVASGLGEDDARNPLEIDLGAWVQDDATANEMLAWLTGNVTEPMPTLTGVAVTPKASRRLGDVIRIKDPQYTAVASKALIVGIQNEGSDGVLKQSLDLAILAVTFNDLDAWLVSQGVSTFDQLDTLLTSMGLTTFDALDAFIPTIGGLG